MLPSFFLSGLSNGLYLGWANSGKWNLSCTWSLTVIFIRGCLWVEICKGFSSSQGSKVISLVVFLMFINEVLGDLLWLPLGIRFNHRKHSRESLSNLMIKLKSLLWQFFHLDLYVGIWTMDGILQSVLEDWWYSFHKKRMNFHPEAFWWTWHHLHCHCLPCSWIDHTDF